MNQVVARPGITFAVDAVKPAAEALPTCRAHEAVNNNLGSGIESCSDYHEPVVSRINYHPLLAAVFTAFNDHRPLVLTPDAVWLTIAQGVAHHMAIHGERLRSRFVAHEGKLDLVFECNGWIEGTPENPWIEAFASWSDQIRQHVGDELHDTLVCDFATTGPVERAASHVAMMDIFDRYFHYVAYGICGIPNITLEGATADWKHLAAKVNGLRRFDIDWWLDHLKPICGQFVRASEGDVDVKHWRRICKLREAYGGGIINGWVAKLYPYVRSFIGGPCKTRNPIFETGEGFQTLVAPSGLSRVPFAWKNAATGRTRLMEAVGGLVGITQDRDSLALRPKVGWAVREVEKLDSLLARLAKEHVTFPGIDPGNDYPEDLAKLFHRTNGAELFGTGEDAFCRIAKVDGVEPLDWGEQPEIGNSRGPTGRIWNKIARLRDGSWLAINLDWNCRDPRPTEPGNWRYDPLFHPICHGRDSTQGQPGRNPVVALSFTELLERLLAGDDTPYWEKPHFVDYGDAEVFTRRD